MNLASWIILIFILFWIFVAVKVAFFGGFGKKGSSCHGSREEEDDDEKYKLPSACSGCTKGSCSGCPSARNNDVPMPTIHELK